MQGIEAQNTLYLTTSRGIYRTDSITSSPIPSGIPTALDVSLRNLGTGGGWFSPNNQVAYRVLWGRVDRFGRLLQGAPSFREVITNSYTNGLSWVRTVASTTVTVSHTSHGYAISDLVEIANSTDTTALPNGTYSIQTVPTGDSYTISGINAGGTTGTCSDGKSYNVEVNFTIPDDIGEGDFYELHRTSISGSATTDPGDRLNYVIRYQLAGADITISAAAGVATVTQTSHGFSTGDVVRIISPNDTRLEAGRHVITNTGTNTYTYAITSTATFTGAARSLRMHIVVTDDWDFALGDDLYTNLRREGILQANARPPYAKAAALFKDIMFYANTKRAHFMDVQIVDVAGLVDNTSSISITELATTKTYTFSTGNDVSLNRFKRETGLPTDAQKVAQTAKNLCRAINRDPGSLWYAYYISGINDPPGQIVIESRTIGTSAFSVIANNSTTASKFSPTFPTTGASLLSDNQAEQNRIYYSKIDQPEAVPELNFEEVGDPSKAILKILALRDSLVIITEAGTYRLTVNGDQLDIKQLDPTIHARAPGSWCVHDNSVFGLSTDGIVRITEGSTTLVSFQIDDIINKIMSFPNYESVTHAIPYESENKYILWCQELSTDTQAKIAWVYNSLTKRWFGPWTKPARTGHVLFREDRLYLSQWEDSRVLKERKAFDINDFYDEEIDVVSSEVGTELDEDGVTVSYVVLTGYSYAQKPEEGWLYRKDPAILPYSKVTHVDQVAPQSFKLRLASSVMGLTTGNGRVAMPIVARLEWTPETADAPGVMKHFQDVQIYMERGTVEHSRIGFYSDINATEGFVGDRRTEVTDAGTLVRSIVPQPYRRARALSLVYESRYGLEPMDIVHVAYGFRSTSDRTLVRQR
jgi:hypothetical protein